MKTLFSLNFSGVAVISDNGRCVNYAELAELADQWHIEISTRSLVFLLVSNTLESLIAYVSCMRRGVVPLMLDANIDKQLLDKFVSIYHPAYVVDTLRNIFVTTKYGMEARLHDDLALLLTTSGSTGSPKLVRQSYANIIANTYSIIEYLKIDSSEKPITTLPMNYTYGLSIINTHLHAGGTILLTNYTVMQREFWDFFNRYGATSFGGVPYTYEMLDRLMFFRRKLPTLRTMTQAGGKLLPTLHKKFAEYAHSEGKNFVVMYGQCEATARMAYLPTERSLDKIGSMGKAIPGGRFELVDGELVYYGENVTLGYAECISDLSKGDEREGRLETGDLATVDEEGFYYIVGRKKRFLKVFGNRLNLDEIERLVKENFPLMDCACGGVDDKVKIYITDKNSIDAVRSFLANKTHINFAAFNVVALEKIPKNSSGKTLYANLI